MGDLELHIRRCCRQVLSELAEPVHTTAMSELRWAVSLSSLSGRNLGGPASSAPSAPYLKLSLDNAWEGATAARKGASPSWDAPAGADSVSYSTRHAERLADKALLVEVWDKPMLGSHRLVGEGRIDLLSLFTGPSSVEVPITDKSHSSRGAVLLTVRAQQIVAVAAVLRGLVFELENTYAADAAILAWTAHIEAPSGSSAGAGVSASISTARASGEASCVETATAGGAPRYTVGDVRTVATTVLGEEIWRRALVLRCGRGAASVSAELPVLRFYAYGGDAGTGAPFEADLHTLAGAPVGTVRGTVTFLDLPVFLQMPTGRLVAGERPAIDGAQQLLADAPRRPRCPVAWSGAPPLLAKDGPLPAGLTEPSNLRAEAMRDGGDGAALSALAERLAAAGVEEPVTRRRSVVSSNTSPRPQPPTSPKPFAAHRAAAETAAFAVGAAAEDGVAPVATAPTTAASAACDDATSLPPGWSAAKDDVGDTYYWHTNGQTTWERPEGDATAAMSTAAGTTAAAAASVPVDAPAVATSSVDLSSACAAAAVLDVALGETLSSVEAVLAARAADAADGELRAREAASARADLEATLARLRSSGAEFAVLVPAAAEALRLRAAADEADAALKEHDVRAAAAAATAAAALRRSQAALAAAHVEAASAAASVDSGRLLASLQAAARESAQALSGGRAAVATAAGRAERVRDHDEVCGAVERAASALAAAEAEVRANAAASSAPAPVPQPPPSPLVAASPQAPRYVCVLPPMWTRCVAADGRLYFQNAVTRGTAWALPTASTVEVVWPVPSPLGLHIEMEDAPGRPGFKICVLRDGSRAPSFGARGAECLEPGMVLASANGIPLPGRPLNDVLAVISAQARPLHLLFHNPYAVSPDVAAAAMDPRVLVETQGQPAPWR